jgi:YggT family protein
MSLIYSPGANPPTVATERRRLPRAAMYAVYNLIDTIIGLYIWILIASVVMSWLIAFNVINTRNQVVYMIGDVLHRLTEPLLRPIRSLLPSMGGLDISPIILILALYFVRDLAFEYLRPL